MLSSWIKPRSLRCGFASQSTSAVGFDFSRSPLKGQCLHVKTMLHFCHRHRDYAAHTHTAIWQPCQADSKRGRERERGPRPESSCSVEIRLNRSLCSVIWGEIPTHSDQTLLACGNTLIVLLCRTYFIYFGNCKIHVNVRTTNSSDIHTQFLTAAKKC